MSLVEFVYPEELQTGVSFREILQAMLDNLPEDIDKTEGSFAYDMVSPTALEAAELLQFWLPLGLKNSFHMFAQGKWLDYCGHDAGGIERRAATFAYGDVVVVTTEAVTFPKGFVFSVPSENSSPAITFETTEENSIDEAGTLKIRVKTTEAGTGSNVRKNSISIMKTPIRGVESINNPENITGGVEAESDDSLRQRIDDYYAGRSSSFVGNAADYRRWALEVPGVGYVTVIPTFDGANSVKLVIADSNGDPANAEILAAVDKYIFGESHEDLARLAPIGARGVTMHEVVAPDTVPINISIKIKIADGFTAANVKLLVEASLKKLFLTLADNTDHRFGTLRHASVNDALYHTAGVADFKDLVVNGATDNVTFALDEMPVVGEIEFLDFD